MVYNVSLLYCPCAVCLFSALWSCSAARLQRRWKPAERPKASSCLSTWPSRWVWCRPCTSQKTSQVNGMKLVTIMKNQRWMATFSLMPLSRVTSLLFLSLWVIAFPFLHPFADPNTWGFIACMAWHSLCTEALCSFTSYPLFVTEVKDEYKQSRWKTSLQINVIWDFINLPLSALAVIYMPIPGCYFLLCLSAGAHLNPAVTLSFCVLEKAPWGKLVPYSLSQLLGAYVASGLVYLVYYGMSVCHLKSFITRQIFSEESVYDCDTLSSLSNRLLDFKQAELFIKSKCILKANEKSEKLYSLSCHVKRLTELSILHRNK